MLGNGTGSNFQVSPKHHHRPTLDDTAAATDTGHLVCVYPKAHLRQSQHQCCDDFAMALVMLFNGWRHLKIGRNPILERRHRVVAALMLTLCKWAISLHMSDFKVSFITNRFM